MQLERSLKVRCFPRLRRPPSSLSAVALHETLTLSGHSQAFSTSLIAHHSLSLQKLASTARSLPPCLMIIFWSKRLSSNSLTAPVGAGLRSLARRFLWKFRGRLQTGRGLLQLGRYGAIFFFFLEDAMYSSRHLRILTKD